MSYAHRVPDLPGLRPPGRLPTPPLAAIAGLAAAAQLGSSVPEGDAPELKQLLARVGRAAAAAVGSGVQELADWIHARTESLRPDGRGEQTTGEAETGDETSGGRAAGRAAGAPESHAQESGEQPTGTRGQPADAERGTGGPGEGQAGGERSGEAEPARESRPERRTRVTGRPTHPAAARRRR